MLQRKYVCLILLLFMFIILVYRAINKQIFFSVFIFPLNKPIIGGKKTSHEKENGCRRQSIQHG